MDLHRIDYGVTKDLLCGYYHLLRICYGFTKDLLRIYYGAIIDLPMICYGFTMIYNGFTNELLWIY